MDFSKTNEWELAIEIERALKIEDYKTCEAIKKEINKRVRNKTINKSLMMGFKYWNPDTQKFEGKPSYGKVNGLFDEFR
jgi:hypothetical protein